jgi:uncharacterized membrane protein (UPF0136 family)
MSNLPTSHLIAACITGLYGLVALVGGVIGYVNKGSVQSLIAGAISGIVLIICAVVVPRWPFWSLVVSLIVALVLAGRFGMVLVGKRDQLGEFVGTVGGITAVVMVTGGALVIIATLWALLAGPSQPPAGS